MSVVELLCQILTKTQKHNKLFLLHEILARPSHANDEHEGEGSLTGELHSEWWTHPYKSPALLADFSCAQSPTKEPIHRLSSSPNLHLKGIN